jgi:hypothetical protein
MDDKRLRKLLEQLQNEINHTKNVDEKGRILLENTQKDVQALLHSHDTDSTISHAETSSRLEETIAHMEATHPDLTTMLTDLLNILSNAGI